VSCEPVSQVTWPLPKRMLRKHHHHLQTLIAGGMQMHSLLTQPRVLGHNLFSDLLKDVQYLGERGIQELISWIMLALALRFWYTG
jgi:hypothetical protein